MQLLIVRESGSRDRVFDMYGEDVVIGRARSCDLRLPNVSVSREHARVLWDEGNYAIKDLGSHNGIYVNGERVEQHPLASGDEIRLGKYELVYIHGRVPRAFIGMNINAMPRWHSVTIGGADDSTFALSESLLQRLIQSRRILEGAPQAGTDTQPLCVWCVCVWCVCVCVLGG